MKIFVLAAALATLTGNVLFAADQSAHEIKSVDQKSFILKMGIWVDEAYDPDSMADQVSRIRYLSEEYLLLLDRQPEIRPYLALGTRLILVYEGKVIAITSGA